MKITEKLRMVVAVVAVLAMGVGGVVSGDAYADSEAIKVCKNATQSGSETTVKYLQPTNGACTQGDTLVDYYCKADAATTKPEWSTEDSVFTCATGAIPTEGTPEPNNNGTQTATNGTYTCPDGQRKPSKVDGKTVDYTEACKDNGVKSSQASNLMNILNTIINVVIGLVGFVAVVMIIVGGIQYTTSSGDTGKTTKAKNTIMYGVVGLVISLLAFAIVNFILANVFNAG